VNVAEQTSAFQEVCLTCSAPLRTVRYYLNDLRDGFVQVHVFCSKERLAAEQRAKEENDQSI
jgi:hypothetical protein